MTFQATHAARRSIGAAAMLVAAATVLITAAPASAVEHSFEGSCSAVGVATFPPMGVVPAPPDRGSFSYKGSGRCMGTLDGKRLPQGGAPVSIVSRGPKPGHSCEVGFDPGSRWALTFNPRRSMQRSGPRSRTPRPATIVGTMDVVDGLRGQVIVLRGQVSGLAMDHGQGQGHGETLEDCVRGELTSGVMSVQMDTITPLVSDDLGPGWINGHS